MREANDRGYECLLVEDATESYFPEFKAAALEMIAAQGGIVGWAAPLRGRAGRAGRYGGRAWRPMTERTGRHVEGGMIAACKHHHRSPGRAPTWPSTSTPR